MNKIKSCKRFFFGSEDKNLIGRHCKCQLDGKLLSSQDKGDGLGPADAGDARQEEDGAFVVARDGAQFQNMGQNVYHPVLHAIAVASFRVHVAQEDDDAARLQLEQVSRWSASWK